MSCIPQKNRTPCLPPNNSRTILGRPFNPSPKSRYDTFPKPLLDKDTLKMFSGPKGTSYERLQICLIKRTKLIYMVYYFRDHQY